MTGSLLNLLISLLLSVNLVQSGLVPLITNNYFDLRPLGDHEYTLNLNHDAVGAKRNETVKQTESGDMEVKGETFQIFPLDKTHELNVVVNYKAGPNGYTASYSYKNYKLIFGVLRLGGLALKSFAG